MRLKIYNAPTMSAVMAQVRDELGPDAIIISVEQGKKVGGVRVTAAVEGASGPAVMGEVITRPAPSRETEEFQAPISQHFDNGEISAVVNYHGLPGDMAGHLDTAARAVNAASLNDAFASALETVIRFAPLTDLTSRPIMLVGPPGAGKTVSAAKLTADAVLNRRSIHLISTDTAKAGGVQQLDHFAQLMKQSVATASNEGELAAVMRSADKRPITPELTIIDTQGTNPFDVKELEALLKLIRAAGAEPVLVMPAGIDPLDAQDIAKVFAQLGAKRFIATRLDAARRYGSVVSAARPGFLALAAISSSPYVGEGLESASPLGFARMLTNLPGLRSDNNPKLKGKTDV